MKNRFIILLLFISHISLEAFSQTESPAQGREDSTKLKENTFTPLKKGERFLTLEKPGAIKRIRFYKGQQLEFKLKGSKIKYKTLIQNVKEKSVVIRDTDIALTDFHSLVVYPKKPFLNTLSKFFLLGALGYVAADLVNNSFEPNNVTLIVGGIGLGTSIALRLPLKRTFKLGKKRYLKTLEAF